MTATSECTIVLLTPPGRGAVATVLVEGIEAVNLVSRFFEPAAGRALDSFPVGRVLYGRWRTHREHTGEDVVVSRRDGERVEVCCHGGTAASAAIIGSLVETGCRELAWQDWIQQSETDPISAAARIALARTGTLRTAAILLDQQRGSLREAIERIVGQLEVNDTAAAAEGLAELDDRAAIGLHLVEPWRVVLGGRPNVGKSSLINALVGYQRAIVYHAPGTTRDVVTAHTALDGWPVELADTAGLRSSDDEIEQQGIARAQRQLERAELVLLVHDVSGPWTAEDDALVAGHPSALLVHNKRDLVSQPPADRPQGVSTSAVTGEGVGLLIQRIVARLVPHPPPTGAAVPFTNEQVASIRAAVADIEKGETTAAIASLRGLRSR